MQPTRRTLLNAALAGTGLALIPAPVAAVLRPTPPQTEGPFYPLTLPLDADNDLAQVHGRRSPARGQLTHLVGQVLDSSGQPLAGARVEIWQCDHNGTYHHPDDPGERDPGFQGFGRTVSADDGSYRFRTIRPVPYSGRTPHIHFRILPPDGSRTESLTTQLYVQGDPRNQADFLFRAMGQDTNRVEADFQPYPGPDAQWIARFDPVLRTSVR